MFCFQCEQTSMGSGCIDIGVCGKDHPSAALQDLLLYLTKGVCMYAHRARALGKSSRDIDVFVIEALFTTVTNVNFDYARLKEWVERAVAMRAAARELYVAGCAAAGQAPENLSGAAAFELPGSLAAMVRAGEAVGILSSKARFGDDIAGLLELYTYGLKGAAAYAEHARRLGVEDDALYGRFIEGLDYLTRDAFALEDLVGRCLDAGAINLRAMELLDQAHVAAFGHPEPTRVRIEPLQGKAIVVSGHDLKDLERLLQQTAGKGINVYTHGEMLPAHGYPGLKKYKHLVGNYGGAWMDQAREFDDFPGAILMTTNCIQRPKAGYFNRIFTSGMVAWPGVTHIDDGDFTPVIEAALAAPGFAVDGPARMITVGFGRNAVLSAADKVIAAVKSGAIRRFFLIGGCDGSKPGRNYYTELAQAVPDDCMILTLACGKYRFNKLEFGEIGGIPRLLDIGQCNDAYSAIQIAVALAQAFECGVNDLPLSLVLSWYEQKAVAILLTLLHLGIKNIRLGPSLPAFVTPNVLALLIEHYQLKPLGKVEDDLVAMLN